MALVAHTVTCRCGKEFTAERSTAKYCSTRCKGRYNQRKQRRVRIPSNLRMKILRLDGFRCVYCGAAPEDTSKGLHVDHFVSVDDGGDALREANLGTACAECNLGKSSDSLSQTEIDEILERRAARAELIGLKGAA